MCALTSVVKVPTSRFNLSVLDLLLPQLPVPVELLRTKDGVLRVRVNRVLERTFKEAGKASDMGKYRPPKTRAVAVMMDRRVVLSRTLAKASCYVIVIACDGASPLAELI